MKHIRPKGYWNSSPRGYSTEVLMICNCNSCTSEWLTGDGREIVATALVKNFNDSREIKRALESDYFDEIESVEQWRRAQ